MATPISKINLNGTILSVVDESLSVKVAAVENALASSNIGIQNNVSEIARIDEKVRELLVAVANVNKKIYKVGAILFTDVDVNPSLEYGGVWASWGSGKVPVGVDVGNNLFKTVNKVGGDETHVHALDGGYAKMITSGTTMYYKYKTTPQWHAAFSNTLVGAAGNTEQQAYGLELGGDTSRVSNIMPYITCYMWKKTSEE